MRHFNMGVVKANSWQTITKIGNGLLFTYNWVIYFTEILCYWDSSMNLLLHMF